MLSHRLFGRIRRSAWCCGFAAIASFLAASTAFAQPQAPWVPTWRSTSAKFGSGLTQAAASVPSGFVVDTANREEVRLFFRAIYNASEGADIQWTGDYAATDPSVAAGGTAADFKDAVNLRVNYFRAMAGVPASVVFDSNYSAKAQQAALMMSANNTLSHNPEPTWQLYSADGDEAAGNSNLALGSYGPSAIDGYMADPGSNNFRVGHRRWVLYPQTHEMGTGDVPGNQTLMSANALWVFDDNFGSSRPFVRDSFVAWPSPGYVPYQIVYARWSLSYPDADFTAASVSMSRDGESLPVELSTVSNGYGENTLVWSISGADTNSKASLERPEADTTYSVTVSDILIGGQPQSFTYDVIVFDPDVVGDDSEPVAISGPATVASGEAVTYTADGLYYASGFRWRTLDTSPFTEVEGGENGLDGILITSTGSYDVLTSSAHPSGAFAFHLAHATTAMQAVEFDRTFLASDSAQLSFESRLGYASSAQVAHVQISLDDGSSWSDIYTQSGNDGAGEGAFAQRSVSLAGYAQQTFRVRFTYTFSDGSYYPGTGSSVGWYFDDVSFLGVDEVTPLTESEIASGSQFAWTPSQAGTYRLQARGIFFGQYPLDWGPVFSVEVNDVAPQAPAIEEQPGSTTVVPGGNVTLSATVSGSPAPALQWYKDGVVVDGATSASLTLLHVDTSDAGSYTLVATNDSGSVTSAPAVVEVTAVPAAPVISLPPVSQRVVAGESVVFTIVASGFPAPTFQWSKDGVAIADANASSLAISAASAADAGTYRASVTNSEGSVMSPIATLSVHDAVVITSQPASQTISAGSVSLSVEATGDALSYQWYLGNAGDTSAPIAGARNAAYVTPVLDRSTRFWVRVRSPAQSVSSATALVTVSNSARYFFGTIGGTGDGAFGLVLDGEGEGTFYAFVPSLGETLAGVPVSVSDVGAFALSSPDGSGDIVGSITGSSLTGTWGTSGLMLAGSEAHADGVTSQFAGRERAHVLNTSDDEILGLVGPDGTALVLGRRSDVWTGGLVSVAANGNVTGPLGGSGSVVLELRETTGKVSGTFSSGGDTWSVSGGRSDFALEQRIENLSVRAQVRQGQDIMITGFVIEGSGTKSVLVRGIGPTLESFGVAGALQNPVMRIFRQGDSASDPPYSENDDWGSADDAGSVLAASNEVGAFELSGESTDAGLLLALPAGAYTAHLSGAGGGTGAAIVEVYDADEAAGSGPSARLKNISMRGYAGNGADLIIAGFVIGGGESKRVLIRAVGPELAPFGVSGVLVDPELRLFQSSTEFAYDDDWNDASDVVASSSTVGAFPLEPGSKSAALVVWLAPGAYTAQLGSADGGKGVAIVEVYELP